MSAEAHVAELGLLVPDLEQAVETFAAFGYRPAEVETASGEDGRTLRSIRLTLSRGPDLVLEQLDDRDGAPLLPCWGLDSHPCWYVDDIDAAVAALRDLGMARESRVFGRFGPEAGKGSSYVHFFSPWGMDLELISNAGPLAYEDATERRLWDPSRPPTWSEGEAAWPAAGPRAAVPGCRGTAHMGMRVPDLEQAVDFFTAALGCDEVLRHRLQQRSGGVWTEIPEDGEAPEPDRSVRDERFPAGTRIRVAFVRCGNLNFEFMELAIPGGDGVPRAVFDRSAAAIMHPAFAVDSAKRAGDRLEAVGAVRDDLLPGVDRYLAPWGQAIGIRERSRRSS